METAVDSADAAGGISFGGLRDPLAAEPVKIVECPRDAWQSMPQLIPAEIKAEYLRALMAAGFRHIDAVSFVSPAAVPQMADSERVLALLPPSRDTEIIAIVVNEQGAERAIATEAVTTLGFPYSLSATFLQRNQRQTPEQALAVLETIAEHAAEAGLEAVAYLSMAFGNPYGDPWNQQAVIDACLSLKDLGIREISLADTVGLATPEQVHALLSVVLEAVPDIEVGAHLHASPAQSAPKIAAAYRAGCRRFDTAIGGQGGCPFAQDALVGNVATEQALTELAALGAALPPLVTFDPLITMARAIADKFGAASEN
jgi:hydroxymethylglutaryl-CoA lyase